MSAQRSRSRTSQSYTARLQRRTVAPGPRVKPTARRRGAAVPRRVWPRTALPAGLALAAEVGHLAAAFAQWPVSSARGGYHTVAGAALGLIAVVVYFGPSRRLIAVSAIVATAGPVIWLGGSLFGVSPYRSVSIVVVLALLVAEAALAALLLRAWWQAAQGSQPGQS